MPLITNQSDLQVIDRCREERETLPSLSIGDKSPCLELLRRAIVLWSPIAFEAVHKFYAREFISWVIKHPRYEELCTRVPFIAPEDIVQKAYIKLHRALSAREDFYTSFTSIGRFLAYCKGTITNCVNDNFPRKSQTSSRGSSNSVRIDLTDADKVSAIDAKYSNERVEDELNWESVTAYIKTLLPTVVEHAVLTHKLYGIPSEHELHRMGISPDHIKSLWQQIRLRLYRDSKLRGMLGL